MGQGKKSAYQYRCKISHRVKFQFSKIEETIYPTLDFEISTHPYRDNFFHMEEYIL